MPNRIVHCTEHSVLTMHILLLSMTNKKTVIRHCDNIEKEVDRCCINYGIVDKVMLAKGNYSLTECQQFKVKQDSLYRERRKFPKLFKYSLKTIYHRIYLFKEYFETNMIW